MIGDQSKDSALAKFARAALWLVLGIVAGYWLATWRGPVTPVAIVAAPTAVDAARSPAATGRWRAIATVTDARGDSVSTAILAPDGVVVLPMRFVAHATTLSLQRADLAPLALTRVVAADNRSGLVAVATHGVLPGSLPAPARTASLYVGRDVSAHTPVGIFAGQVDAPAARNALGSYEYALAFPDSRATAQAGPLLDGETLIGYLLPAAAQDGAVAVDAATLADLVDSSNRFDPLPVAAFAEYYRRETPAGRLENAEALVAGGRWREGLDASHALLRLDPVYAEAAARLLSTATRAGVNALSEASRHDAALALLDETDALLGADPARILLRGSVLEAAGNSDAAVRAYLAAGDPGRTAARSLIARAAEGGWLSEDNLLRLVTRALAHDSRHANYHRIAGLIHLRAGRDAAAVTSLSMAAALSSTMAAELEPLMERARNRLDNPARIDVPVTEEGSVLIVAASLNGSPSRRMLLDTGATYTAISLETALRLGIRDLFFGAPVVGLETANGRLYTNVIILPSIAIGAARAFNVEVVILETMRGVDGLLGQSFLNRFDVDIRRDAGIVSLTPR